MFSGVRRCIQSKDGLPVLAKLIKPDTSEPVLVASSHALMNLAVDGNNKVTPSLLENDRHASLQNALRKCGLIESCIQMLMKPDITAAHHLLGAQSHSTTLAQCPSRMSDKLDGRQLGKHTCNDQMQITRQTGSHLVREPSRSRCNCTCTSHPLSSFLLPHLCSNNPYADLSSQPLICTF